MREFLDVWLHFAGPQRAIQSYHQRIGMRDRGQKSFDRLATQDPARAIRYGSRNDERNLFAGFLKQLGDGRDRGLGIQGVEDGLDHKQIDTTLEQCSGLFAIRLSNLIERDGAKTRIVYV